ncbi:MAG: hypothetical protein IJ690_01590 [Clostridia bacterium]|nr:hypothetical protein [Clostridia bacterium]
MIEENNVIIADGRSLPTPSDYTPYPTLREQSTENALGDLVRKIISSRWKIEMKWDVLTPTQMDLITKLKFKKEFTCKFPASDGRMLTKKMYVGDIKPAARRIDPNTKLVTEWKDFSCNFIQTEADKYTGGAV